MKLQIGDNAPNFNLKNQDEKEISFADLKDGWTLLHFYIGNNSPGCINEATILKNSLSEFERRKTKVIGITPNSLEKNKIFAKKLDLPFPLLADEKKEIAKKYGAWGTRNSAGRKFQGVLRKSFLINSEGKIVKVYEKVKPRNHAAEVISDLIVNKRETA